MFRVRSWDLQEDVLVQKKDAATAWKLVGPAKMKQITVPTDTWAAFNYDLSKDDTVTLTREFKLSFKAERLYRLYLSACMDDTWHSFDIHLEKNGVMYKGEGTRFLSDYQWNDILWQFPGTEEPVNKIKTWTLLEEDSRSPKYMSEPGKIRVTLVIKRSSPFRAVWAKFINNYYLVFNHIPFWRYIATSVFLVILNMVGTLLSCSLVAYSFARLKWPGRGASFAVMLGTLMIPGQVTLIPFFMIIKYLGMYNTLYPLWAFSFFANAFNVFLLHQFFKGIPRDLEDAAKIDGCGSLRIYWSIMLPLVKPALATISIGCFMYVWSDFMAPLIFLSDQRLYPLSLGLYAFNVQAGSNMSMMMAGSFLMCVPVMVIFFFAQRYFIEGITLTGLKN
jgi:ABC-type glycerol-3-phosphate transport system permease component